GQKRHAPRLREVARDDGDADARAALERRVLPRPFPERDGRRLSARRSPHGQQHPREQRTRGLTISTVHGATPPIVLVEEPRLPGRGTASAEITARPRMS